MGYLLFRSCIPTDNPVVLTIVIVVDPAVLVPASVTTLGNVAYDDVIVNV